MAWDSVMRTDIAAGWDHGKRWFWKAEFVNHTLSPVEQGPRLMLIWGHCMLVGVDCQTYPRTFVAE